MNAHTTFDSPHKLTIVGAADSQALGDDELLSAISSMWRGFIEHLDENLITNGYQDITIDEALHLYGVARGEPFGISKPLGIDGVAQLYRQGYLSGNKAKRTPIITDRGRAAIALMDEALDAQTQADEMPQQQPKIGIVGRTMQIFGRDIEHAA